MKEPKITRIIIDDKIADQELVQRYKDNNPDAEVIQIALSEENIRQETGGPFSAIVVNEATGELVSVGMNLVTSSGL